MIALIDGDIVGYRSAASCNPTKIKPDLEPLDVALMRAEDLMRRILQETGAESYRLFIGGDRNYRYDIEPSYKANRKDTPRPPWLQDVRAYLCTDWNAEITDGIEADDAMGINQTDQTIICSIDKDLLMIPGKHYNFVNMEQTFTTPIDGLRRFYQQLIQGDSSDNIMGYDGKARPKIPKFLQPDIDYIWSCDDEISMFNHVRDMYKDDARLLRTGQLLNIQRFEGDMWTLPTTD